MLVVFVSVFVFEYNVEEDLEKKGKRYWNRSCLFVAKEGKRRDEGLKKGM